MLKATNTFLFKKSFIASVLCLCVLSTSIVAQNSEQRFNGFDSSFSEPPQSAATPSNPGIYRPHPRAAGIQTSKPSPVQPAAWIGSKSKPELPNSSDTSIAQNKPLWSTTSDSAAPSIKKPSSPWSSTISMFMSLLLVLTLFMGVAWCFRGATQQPTRHLSKDVVHVLGRTPLAPRHSMILLRFGRKLVLVSQQMGQTQTLSEIDDPEEVDHLLGLCEQSNANSISSSFRDVLSQFASGKGSERSATRNLCFMLAIGFAGSLFSGELFAQSTSSTIDYPPVARDSSSPNSVEPLLRAATNSLFGEAKKGLANTTNGTAAAEGDANLLDGPAKWVSPEGLNGSLQIMLLLTVLSLAPAILLMTTCYVRIIVVMGLLRQALGTAQLPPSQVITSISLFVTLFVMAPVWSHVYEDSIKPYTDPKSGMTMEQAWDKGVAPIRKFMSRQIDMAGNYDDVKLFYSRHSPNSPPPNDWEEVPLTVLLPAYMLSELKTAFMMGFQIYLPFLILDIVIASVTISMGMMMLPPAMISMPFKLLLFVLVDGWHLVVEMLLDSFGTYGT